MNSLDCHSLESVREQAHRAGKAWLCVRGTSMAPAIQPGDLITVESAKVRDIQPGDLVVFGRDGRLVTHRVAFTNDSAGTLSLVTRGDRARQYDAAVSESELIGRVTSVWRDLVPITLQTQLGAGQRLLGLLLRVSDRGTYVYLSLAKRWRKIFRRRMMCQA